MSHGTILRPPSRFGNRRRTDKQRFGTVINNVALLKMPGDIRLLAIVITAIWLATQAIPNLAQIRPTFAQTASELNTRCMRLIAFYERYGAGRSETSDGQRNMIVIAAKIDCEKGRYQQGISAMEDLLRRKKFEVPPT